MKLVCFPWQTLRRGLLGICLLGVLPSASFGEAMLQYFNTSWKEMSDRMPELAEAGYSSLWLPPPTKASGGLSVGYDLFDPFDLGGRSQRSTVTTRYGTEAELLNLIETAHRFGIRVYADNIMNHRAFDIPAFNESTPVDVYPGMLPEDFHLRRTEDGFYRKWDNTRDWNDAWQVMNLGLSDLVDIAHETPNTNHGLSEGDDSPKPSYVRHPTFPEFYDRMPNLAVDPSLWDAGDWSGDTNKNIYIGFGTNNGLTTNVLADYPDFFNEDVGGYLCRSVRWLMETTKMDGLRLDAVKHVPDYFFGAYDDDASSAGYCGSAQWQFNMSRGFSDWSNHRDSNFNTEIPRDDAILFGEHLGEPPGYSGYWSTGMRLVDNDLRSQLNNRLGSMWNGLEGYDAAGYGGFDANLGVMHAQSHDNDYAAAKELQHAFYFLREGLGLLYTDGNHHAETLGESGGAFPRWADTAFLGQWSDNRVPNLLYCHEQFGRGYQRGVWSDGDYVAWERLDWRQNGSTAADHVTMLVMLNDNYSSGESRGISSSVSFPHTSPSDDAYLYNYSDYGGGFYTYASALDSVVVPGGGYFIFGYKNPDPAPMWTGFGGEAVSLYEDGVMADTVAVDRKDGPDGDAAFNPYGLTDTNTTDYTYTIHLPRVTNPSNLSFVAHVDGSAANVMFRLDGGMDLNGATNAYGDLRDNAPALANDLFLGFEQADFVKRIWGEKFAAVDTARNKIGSAGAETYEATIGSAGFTTNLSTGSNDWADTTTVSWIYHDPNEDQDGPRAGNAQFWPPLTNAAGATLYVAVKTPKVDGNRLFMYYTTNGLAYPEGAGGDAGNSSTLVEEASWVGEGSDSNDWWEVQVPAMSDATTFRYKVGSAREQGYGGNGWDTVWPGGADDITRKADMMGVWEVTNINTDTIQFYPHNDYGVQQTGLDDGFHLLTGRAFLERDSGSAIYNTFKQTFYLDAETPQGYVQWPASDGATLTGTEYGVVVRTDPSVREVWYRIEDDDDSNDDSVIEKPNGNGDGFEPYTDSNGNGSWDSGEPYTDLNLNATWDGTNVVSWQSAYSTTPSDMDTEYPKAWTFTYANLPTGGTASVRIRLCEWSSADREAWTNAAMTEAEGHFTELTRSVNPRGDAYRLYFDWPSQNGDLVEAGWDIRIKYSWEFAAGLDDAGALALFSIRLNSAENGGDPADGTLLNPEDINLTHTWDFPPDEENTLTFTMPNVYNGIPTWLYGFEVVGERAGYPTLTATRQVTTLGELLPSIMITEPPELGSDGRPHIITIPDVPASVLATNPSLRTTTIRLQTDTNATDTGVYFTSPSGFTGEVTRVSTTNQGSTQIWDYDWSNLVAGAYRFTGWVIDGDGSTNSASRGVTIQLRQIVDMTVTNKLDHDDDGMTDEEESTLTPLPNGFPDTDPRYQANSEFWTNADMVVHNGCGLSLPESPDSDGDGLSDGLEVGWRIPYSGTDTNVDTNGDGWPNFMPDYDPPFYNSLDNYGKVPGVDSQSKGGDRSAWLRGSTTDPANSDTDYDGIPDGIEDWDRDGWVAGDGAIIETTWDPWAERDWPDGEWDTLWTETDPNQSDTDVDGLSDGYGEDKDFDGWINGDSDSNRVWTAGELWTETDPLAPDTDGDGLPDGWEVQYGLDPLDSGVIGGTHMETGAPIASEEHGASGDPDGDSFDNLTELQNGTNPRVYDDPGGQEPEDGAITIGRGEAIGVVNGVTNYAELTQWTLDDLIALDPYNDGGSQAVDIYRRWDDFDTSRDLVAFYMRDGGATDGKLYFRIDFQDLQAYAEESSLDLYVAMDFNSPSTGEAALPDEVDTATDMKWEAVVAVYDSQNGSLFVDSNPALNTVGAWDDLSAAGVVIAPAGFYGAYYNSELDAVEFSIDRSALTDMGWNGISDNLNFQVYATKDGTCNSCVDGSPGAGDIGGRSDLCDTIRNDWICSDYWRDQDWITANGTLTAWIGRNAENNLGQSAKIAMLAHGNQAIQPGSYIHNIVDNNEGAGYQRPVQIHGIYGVPLNLHVTPTLAMALEWAEVKTNGSTWRSGAALNQQIRELVATNVISLMASTYSDHILPYFTSAFNQDNVDLATETLNRIYESNIDSNSVFWPPERVLDGDTLQKILDLGFRYTLVDQNTHIWNWYGRQIALGDDGYRINKLNGVNCFVINNAADGYRFENHDSGIALPMRELFSRRARSDRQDQISTIFCMWEEFSTLDQADAYDKNLRWYANHPWMQLVSLEEIAEGQVSLPSGQTWDPIDRGATAGSKQSHNWINHATDENYDNWYTGSAIRESLETKQFEIRDGVTNATAYGMLYSGGLSSNAWNQVLALSDPDVQRLAAEVIHASVFETAFHEEDNNALDRWSSGGYIYPSADWQDLVDFALISQNQTRMASLYGQVDTWAAAASGLSTTVTVQADSDLDGEDELWLYNAHVCALFERIGGRMIASWHRDTDGKIRQMTGNLVSYACAPSEEEGEWSVNSEVVDGVTNITIEARRTSCLKDWWAGSGDYVNDLYTATTNAVTDGWIFTSGDSLISKTVTLDPGASAFDVDYTVSGSLNGGVLYVRNGFSPDLSELLIRGQRGFSDSLAATGGVVTLTTTSHIASVELTMLDGIVNTEAVDDDGNGFDSVAMRNLAQTRQVELVGTNTLSFSITLSSEDAGNDPPVLSFAPNGPYTNAVGNTNTFTVSAIDPDDDPVVLGFVSIPVGSTFDTNTGVFEWWVTNMGTAGTTNWIDFTADDGVQTVTNTAMIVIPWDSNANGMPDDWEFLWFSGDMTQTEEGDADGDGFMNRAEWVASTDPLAPGSYIGWETLVRTATNVSLTFQAVPGRIYHIEGRENQMANTNTWNPLGSVTNDGDSVGEWVDTEFPDNMTRMYRIKIPAFVP
jgi:Glycosyl hydrolase family 57/Alpha amylase, catalytic domain/Bacterial TSP3 repeat